MMSLLSPPKLLKLGLAHTLYSDLAIDAPEKPSARVKEGLLWLAELAKQ